MPIHDWTRVGAGIFHHFHVGWIDDLSRALNRGLLPLNYYALAEQIGGEFGPDVLTLQRSPGDAALVDEPPGGVALSVAPPRVRFRARAEPDAFAAKARSVVIRHTSEHRIIAIVEIVSPGNKSARHAIRTFVEKAARILRSGIHLVVVDLFAPSVRDPDGIHKAIWDEFIDNDFTLPLDKPTMLTSYIGGPVPESFVEPVAIGAPLPDMPLLLTLEVYIPLPLERTYESAWEAVPAYWREVLAKPSAAS